MVRLADRFRQSAVSQIEFTEALITAVRIDPFGFGVLSHEPLQYFSFNGVFGHRNREL